MAESQDKVMRFIIQANAKPKGHSSLSSEYGFNSKIMLLFIDICKSLLVNCVEFHFALLGIINYNSQFGLAHTWNHNLMSSIYIHGYTILFIHLYKIEEVS